MKIYMSSLFLLLLAEPLDGSRWLDRQVVSNEPLDVVEPAPVLVPSVVYRPSAYLFEVQGQELH